MKILLLLLFTGLFAGYSPDYGPGEQWNPTVSTAQAFILFHSITLNGQTIYAGEFTQTQKMMLVK